MTNREFRATTQLLGLTLIRGESWTDVYYNGKLLTLYTHSRFTDPDHDLAFLGPLVENFIELIEVVQNGQRSI